MRLRFALAIAAAFAVVVASAFAGGGGPRTKLVSKTSGGSPTVPDPDGSFAASVSASGRRVAFESDASNLPGHVSDGQFQAYVRDRKTGRTRLVSRTSSGEPAADSSISGADPVISANGRFVAFESDAPNLPGAQGGTISQVYVRDLKLGRTQLVSRTSGDDPAEGDSEDASISGNGRFVAFESTATNLPGNSGTDLIYIRDLERGRTRLVSKTNGGEPAEPGRDPAISHDGRVVGFESDFADLPGSGFQVYVRDLETRKTQLVSRTTGGTPATGGSEDATASATGRFIAFESGASNLPGGLVAPQQVYLRDRRKGKTVLVSKTSGGSAATGGESEEASVSDSGRFIAFDSEATNLPGDLEQVYIRDRRRGRTRLMSKTNGGEPADGESRLSPNNTVLSARAAFIVFESEAANLPGAGSQIYIRGPLR